VQQGLDRSLASRGDRITLKGKLVVAGTAATGSIFITPLSLGGGLSTRLAGFNSLYMRWRILKLAIYLTRLTTGDIDPVSVGAFGIIDDPESGNPPTTTNDILALRCSTLPSGLTTSQNELYWNPVDPDRWYFTTGGSSVSDPRFSTPAALCFFNEGVATLSASFLVYYTVEMEGASETAGQ